MSLLVGEVSACPRGFRGDDEQAAFYLGQLHARLLLRVVEGLLAG